MSIFAILSFALELSVVQYVYMTAKQKTDNNFYKKESNMHENEISYARDFSKINPTMLNEQGRRSLFEFTQAQGSAYPLWLSAEGIKKFMQSEQYTSLYESAPTSIKNANVSDEEKASAIWTLCRIANTGTHPMPLLDWSLYFSAPLAQ